ncbi:MAG: hypothetical protein DMF68_18950 [Acidobacteria bacterium]|nr:MAG: hypothetical protein DMF68_18950 [Acidobacteriota bacterium]
MSRKDERDYKQSVMRIAFALALLFCAFVSVSPAQQGGIRPARSLTSEDLLNRPTVYIPTSAPSSSVSSSNVVRPEASTLYRDPSGAFTLSFPNSNWRINKRAGKIYNQRSFQRIEAEGFASATASIYVLTNSTNLPTVDASRLSADAQQEVAGLLVSRFLSSNASLVSVEPVVSRERKGLRIIADQTISRRIAVRASINVFEQQGRFYVVVCCSPIETFDSAVREFDAITNSLASSVMRS